MFDLGSGLVAKDSGDLNEIFQLIDDKRLGSEEIDIFTDRFKLQNQNGISRVSYAIFLSTKKY